MQEAKSARNNYQETNKYNDCSGFWKKGTNETPFVYVLVMKDEEVQTDPIEEPKFVWTVYEDVDKERDLETCIEIEEPTDGEQKMEEIKTCLLYTSDAADD